MTFRLLSTEANLCFNDGDRWADSSAAGSIVLILHDSIEYRRGGHRYNTFVFFSPDGRVSIRGMSLGEELRGMKELRT